MNRIQRLHISYRQIILGARFWVRFTSDQGCAKEKASNLCKQEAEKLEKNCDRDKPESQRPKVTRIDGDGVGSEMIESLVKVFSTVQVPIDWDVFHEHKIESTEGEDISPKLLASLCQNKIGIKGPFESGPCLRKLRKKFQLFASVAVCRNLEGQNTPYGKLDCLIIRDQVEGEYSGIEHRVVPGVMQTIKVSTAEGADRMARYVFEYAKKNNRKKITVAHKANIMRLTDGTFLAPMRREAAKYQDDIMFEERYLDTVCLAMLMKPEKKDVLVASSMYGDVLTFMAASIMGGPALCPGFAVGPMGLIYEPIIHTNTNIAGKDIVNPTGMLLSGVLMLREMKLNKYADKICCAVSTVFKETDCRTKDLGGKAKCSEFTQLVCDCLPQS
ncbi:probable isocitrate dehydrogenase [NAD] subunit alpha, mitochondrial [Drosophila tropicalis]|uniref:probable isocitrate dehydrogenase [NAD] subunit alpha, mitochondrial n=1 Tax=Drosophila tropicalis TaxID=46794 RepID=UPI0035AC262A